MNTSHLRVVTHMCGFLVWLYSLSMLPPMLIALIYKERSFFVFLETFLVFLALEALHGWRQRKRVFNCAPVDGFLIIVLFWILFSIISAFPLWIDDEFNLSFVDALFEGVSGITTTGATVIPM